MNIGKLFSAPLDAGKAAGAKSMELIKNDNPVSVFTAPFESAKEAGKTLSDSFFKSS